LKEIASSLSRTVPVIDSTTMLPKAGEFKTEKLLDSVVEIPDKLNRITKLLTVTEPDSVPYAVIEKLNDLSNVITTSSGDQLDALIENNNELLEIASLLNDVSKDVVLGSLNKKIILEDVASQLQDVDLLSTDDFYVNLYDKFAFKKNHRHY